MKIKSHEISAINALLIFRRLERHFLKSVEKHKFWRISAIFKGVKGGLVRLFLGVVIFFKKTSKKPLTCLGCSDYKPLHRRGDALLAPDSFASVKSKKDTTRATESGL